MAVTLGAGDTVTLVCQALCERAVPAAGEMCHDTTSATEPRLTTDADCAAAGLPATAVLREDTHRAGLSIPDAGVVSVLTVPATPASAHILGAGSTSSTLVNPPRIMALRI